MWFAQVRVFAKTKESNEESRGGTGVKSVAKSIPSLLARVRPTRTISEKRTTLAIAKRGRKSTPKLSPYASLYIQVICT